jgi:hypothetical protein
MPKLLALSGWIYLDFKKNAVIPLMASGGNRRIQRKQHI